MASRRILIVEDDVHTSEVINEALKQAGYATECAFSASEAMKKIEEFDPELVLTDHDMPSGSGLDLLNELRQRENYVHVIFVSARAESELVVQALRAGADDYVRKPFRFNELLARIEVNLRNNDLHKQLKEANSQLQDMIERDYLTGLFNMRSMYERIDIEIKRSRRFKRPLAAVMMDMDHFKSVNDTNDHLFGSFVLKEAGHIIQETMREIDMAARYGGDEFLIVLSEANSEGCRKFCERLRAKIKQHTFSDGTNSIQLTVSLGFSVFNGKDEIDSRTLVRQADHALYKAKDSGRDQIAQFGTESSR